MSAKHYLVPDEVDSPRGSVEVDRILIDGGEEDVSVARGAWNGELTLLIRWNGNSERPLGFPSSHGHATWLVVPAWLQNSILSGVAERLDADIKNNNRDRP